MSLTVSAPSSSGDQYQQIRVGVVGCGRMGKEHARVVQTLGARVSFFCDPDHRRSKELARQYPGSVAHDDPRQIDWASIDAIFVCTPPVTRGPIEAAAIKAGVHVFMEKPVGISAEQCRPVLAALDSNPLITAVGYMNRYRNSVIRAKQSLEGSKPIGICSNWIGEKYKVNWWTNNNESGGPFNEQGTHLVDLYRLFMGPVAEVFAAGEREAAPLEYDASVTATLRFASGALGSIYYSCLATEKQIGVRIFLPARCIRLEGWSFRAEAGDVYEPGLGSDDEDIFAKEDAAFFDAIITSNQSLVRSSLEDAIQTQAVVDAINESLRTNQPVLVSG